MAAYRQVSDSRHLHADCQEPRDQFRTGTLRSLVLPFNRKIVVRRFVNGAVGLPVAAVTRSVAECSSAFAYQVSDSSIRSTRHRVRPGYDSRIDTTVLVQQLWSGYHPLQGTVCDTNARKR